MRIVKDPDTRKEEILIGALKVFARKGYDKTTITDIAKELGISQGLCYRYYESKEAIYDTALDQYAERIVSEKIKRFSTNGATLKEQILTFSGDLKEYKQSEMEDSLMYGLFHGENSKKMHDQLILKTAEKLVSHIKEVLTQAKERGELQFENVDTLAYFFVYGQVGLLLAEGDTPECKQKIQECLLEILHL